MVAVVYRCLPRMVTMFSSVMGTLGIVGVVVILRKICPRKKDIERKDSACAMGWIFFVSFVLFLDLDFLIGFERNAISLKYDATVYQYDVDSIHSAAITNKCKGENQPRVRA